jgi:hypothetical protein
LDTLDEAKLATALALLARRQLEQPADAEAEHKTDAEDSPSAEEIA